MVAFDLIFVTSMYCQDPINDKYRNTRRLRRTRKQDGTADYARLDRPSLWYASSEEDTESYKDRAVALRTSTSHARYSEIMPSELPPMELVLELFLYLYSPPRVPVFRYVGVWGLLSGPLLKISSFLP